MQTRTEIETIANAYHALDVAMRDLESSKTWDPFGPGGSFPFQLREKAAADVRRVVIVELWDRVTQCRAQVKYLGCDPGKPPSPGDSDK